MLRHRGQRDLLIRFAGIAFACASLTSTALADGECALAARDVAEGIAVSRVAFQDPALRALRDDVKASGPRGLRLVRWAAENRRPLRPDWRGRGEDRFSWVTVPVRCAPELLSMFVADRDRWTRMQEAAMAGASCSCTIDAIPSPGQVPDGKEFLGSQLRVSKTPGMPATVDLSWGASCGGAEDYAVDEGTLGSWYSHGAILCSTGGMTFARIAPGGASRYYLVVPLNAEAEGSGGTNSAGAERPQAVPACRAIATASRCR